MQTRRTALGLLFAASVAGCMAALPADAVAAPVTFSVRGSDGKALDQAVIAVTVKGAKPQAPAGTTAEIAQRERTFLPMLRVVQSGTAVQFPNFDVVRHHVYSVAPVKRFELKLYVGTPAEPVLFDKAGVAVLGCNIHDRMRAWVVVVDTPHFATSGADGKAVLDLPLGQHAVRVWHPGMSENAAWVELAVAVEAAGAAVGIEVPSRAELAKADR